MGSGRARGIVGPPAHRCGSRTPPPTWTAASFSEAAERPPATSPRSSPPPRRRGTPPRRGTSPGAWASGSGPTRSAPCWRSRRARPSPRSSGGPGALAALPDPPWLAIRQPPSGAPEAEVAAYDQANRDARDGQYAGAFGRLLGEARPDPLDRLAVALRERMTVFWSNHFVADHRSHGTATWTWEYRALLRRHALGDVREAVREVGTTPAMLHFLNGNQNRVGRPNENYARELLELFTMGPEAPDGTPNYAQADVVDLARALTGWRTDKRAQAAVTFDPDRFDGGQKTVLGQTGPWGYDDVVPILFGARAPQIAAFLARALYREVVAEEADPAVVAAVAGALLAADFEVAPALAALLSSAHFFAPERRGALIASPLDLLLGATRSFGVAALDGPAARRVRSQATALGQDLLSPPDVFGWRTGRAWIDTSTLTERARRLRDDAHRQRGVIQDEAAARPTASVARELARDLATDLLAQPPSEAELDGLTEVLLAGTPAYSWDPTETGGRNRVRDYVKHLVSLPDAHLR